MAANTQEQIYTLQPGAGFSPRLILVDLSADTIETVYVKADVARKYLGGAGLAAKIIWQETTAETDALSGDNPLIFMTGPLTGAVPYGGRHIVAGLSPLTGIYGEAHSGGHWAFRLRSAGYDGVIVRGRADTPKYLFIDADRVELRDAKVLWGMDCYEFEDALNELEGNKVSTAAIGQAGENLVKFACVVNDGKRGRAAARCGFGALMGYKKLKGIAVRSAGAPEVYDKKSLKASVEKYFPKGKITNAVRKTKGRELWESLWQMGRAPIQNWASGEFAEVDDTIVDVLSESAKYDFCFGCRTSCVESRLNAQGKRHTVWEALCPIGTQCLIADYDAVHLAYDYCNRYGIDSISLGATLAFAIECAEAGLIEADLLEGLDLRWGNAGAVLALIKKITFREGRLAEILAEGTLKAARIIGNGAERFAMQGKGLEIAAHDPRAYNGAALENATSTFGASHMSGFTSIYYDYTVKEDLDGADISHWVATERLSPYQTEGQGKLTARAQDFICLLNSLTLCLFTNSTDCFGRPPLQPPSYLDFLNAATGWDADLDEFYRMGERIFNLQRMICVRRGVRAEDDTLPERFLKTTRGAGPAGENLPDLDVMLAEYYDVRGWGQDGIPTDEKLKSLGLYECL
ncbi:MAG: aldehyde ferredoxin oxidoreductase family protein [Desulfobacterales bacterium]|jgi:aldehyde:ferredoxin oxidoreductase